MKHEKFSLENLDDETIDRIENDYPPEWDMDKIFNKSYKRFLKSDKEKEIITEPYPVEVVKSKYKFSIGNAVSVACVAVMLILCRAFLIMPEDEIETPDNIEVSTITTQRTTHSTTSTIRTTTTSSSKSTSTSTTTQTMTQTEAQTTTTEIDIIVDTIPTTTEQQTIPQTTTTETQTMTESTTITTTTTDRTENPYGYFTVSDSHFIYVRNKDDVVEKKEYSVELDGFTATKMSEDNYSMSYSLKDNATDYGFQLVIFPYEYFKMGSRLDISYLERFAFFEINDKPACAKKDDGCAMVYWDNGYNICYCIGSYDHYDSMILLAENLKEKTEDLP